MELAPDNVHWWCFCCFIQIGRQMEQAEFCFVTFDVVRFSMYMNWLTVFSHRWKEFRCFKIEWTKLCSWI